MRPVSNSENQLSGIQRDSEVLGSPAGVITLKTGNRSGDSSRLLENTALVLR
jgi:hypothetical protein